MNPYRAFSMLVSSRKEQSHFSTAPPPKRLTHLNSKTGAAHMVHIPPPVASRSSPSSFTDDHSLHTRQNRSATAQQEEASASTTDQGGESVNSTWSGGESGTEKEKGSKKHEEIKPATARTAIARATVHFSNASPTTLIRTAALKKGDVLSVARVAGIMASKKTSDIVPLCHNIPLSGVEIELEVVGGHGGIDGVSSGVSPDYKTGNKNMTNGESERQIHSVRNISHNRGSKSLAAGELEDQTRKYEADPEIGVFGAVVITATVHTYGQTGVEMEALVAANAAALTVYDMCKGVDRAMHINGLRVVLKRGGRSGTWTENLRVESKE